MQPKIFCKANQLMNACMDPLSQFNTPSQRGQKGNGLLLRQPKNVRYERTHLSGKQQV